MQQSIKNKKEHKQKQSNLRYGKQCLFTHFIHLVSLLIFLLICLLLLLHWKRSLSPHAFKISILSLDYWVFKSMYVSLYDKQQTTWTSNSWQETCICMISITFMTTQSDKSSYGQPVAYPGVLFGWGFNKFSWRQRMDLVAVAPYSGVLEAAVILYKKFHFI